jgi:hypothetical protein
MSAADRIKAQKELLEEKRKKLEAVKKKVPVSSH